MQPGPFLPLVLVLQALLFLGNFCSFTEGTKGLFFAIEHDEELGQTVLCFFYTVMCSSLLVLLKILWEQKGHLGHLGKQIDHL